MKSVHEKVRYECEICKKQVSSKDSLKLHMKRIHLLEKQSYKQENSDEPKLSVNENSEVQEFISEPKEPIEFKRGTWIVKLERLDCNQL